MEKFNVFTLPVAANICNQILREIEKTERWSAAHVIMNPKTESLIHKHRKMEEIYIITRGHGNLTHIDLGLNSSDAHIYRVQPGDAIFIHKNVWHKLENTGLTGLEHLVLAIPPFDPRDVHLNNNEYRSPRSFKHVPFVQPPICECFDGARIVSYQFDDIASIALGVVNSELSRQKPSHYHKKITEWAYVVEGHGAVELNENPYPINRGDWIRFNPGEKHAFRNENVRNLVVVCMCTPCFSMEDVYF